MAEENERQMEDELNRALFEHNSTPTEGSSHLSPIV
jgi:hypothetical protein